MNRFVNPRWFSVALSVAILTRVPACVGSSATETSLLSQPSPLSDATILIIRHAEKPEFGSGLSPEGQARAQAYVRYFQDFRIDSKRLHLDYVVAADDSEHSQRSRLTVEPLTQALGLKPDLRFLAKEAKRLAGELETRPHGKAILICWHHHEIPDLLRALGADPDRLLPHGQWPTKQFGWVLRLSYDHQGRLIRKETKRIKQHLMPDD